MVGRAADPSVRDAAHARHLQDDHHRSSSDEAFHGEEGNKALAASNAAGGAELHVLDNVVRYASPELSTILMEKYETHRVDYLVHAEELAHFAQAIEMEARPGHFFGKEVVAHVDESTPRKETRTGYGYGKIGHVKADCHSKRTGEKNGGRGGNTGGNVVLAIGEGTSKKESLFQV